MPPISLKYKDEGAKILKCEQVSTLPILEGGPLEDVLLIIS